jgi:hypothetical protein
MLGQERRVHLGLALRAQMNTLFLGHGGGMLGLCGTYVGLLGAMLGPFWACWWGWNVDIQPAPRLDSNFDGHVGPMWDLCWPYVRACCALAGHVGAILSLCWALVGPKRGGSFKPWFKSVNDKNEPLVWGHLGTILSHLELMLGRPRTACSRGLGSTAQINTLFLDHVGGHVGPMSPLGSFRNGNKAKHDMESAAVESLCGFCF